MLTQNFSTRYLIRELFFGVRGECHDALQGKKPCRHMYILHREIDKQNKNLKLYTYTVIGHVTVFVNRLSKHTQARHVMHILPCHTLIHI